MGSIRYYQLEKEVGSIRNKEKTVRMCFPAPNEQATEKRKGGKEKLSNPLPEKPNTGFGVNRRRVGINGD
jgi:hypothetical protein